MSPVAKGAVHLVAALAIGAGSGAGAVALVAEHRESRLADWEATRASMPEPRDRVLDAAAELRRDGVHVAPDGRRMLDEAGERTVERAVAAADVPVHVVVWADQQQVGISSVDLPEQLARELGPERGVLLVWAGPEAGAVEEVGGDGYVPDISPYSDFVGEPAVTLPRLVRAAQGVEWFGESDDDDYWGGTGGGIAAGLLFASGAVPVVLFLLWAVGKALPPGRLPGRWTWREDG